MITQSSVKFTRGCKFFFFFFGGYIFFKLLRKLKPGNYSSFRKLKESVRKHKIGSPKSVTNIKANGLDFLLKCRDSPNELKYKIQ